MIFAEPFAQARQPFANLLPATHGELAIGARPDCPTWNVLALQVDYGHQVRLAVSPSIRQLCKVGREGFQWARVETG